MTLFHCGIYLLLFPFELYCYYYYYYRFMACHTTHAARARTAATCCGGSVLRRSMPTTCCCSAFLTYIWLVYTLPFAVIAYHFTICFCGLRFAIVPPRQHSAPTLTLTPSAVAVFLAFAYRSTGRTAYTTPSYTPFYDAPPLNLPVLRTSLCH